LNTKILNFAPRNDGAGIDVTLYGVIGDDWFGPPIEAEISAQLGAAPNAHATVHINSEGGDMFAGIAIRNMFAAHPGGVTCIVEGLAASAASIIAMAGKTVMGKGSMLMIHNPWAIVAGGAEELRATADMLDKAQVSLVSIYQEKTGKGAAELSALLAAETWFTADEALAAGFANEVSTGRPMEVSALADAVVLNSVSFPRAKVPAQILAMAGTPRELAPKSAAAAREIICAYVEQPNDDGSTTKSIELFLPFDAGNPKAIAGFRGLLTDHAPGFLAALLDEGKAAGIAEEAKRSESSMAMARAQHGEELRAERDKGEAAAVNARATGTADGAAAERARLKAIDEVTPAPPVALVLAAKYGDKPTDAAALKIAAWEAHEQAGLDHLAARRAESAAAAAVRPGAPEQATQAAENAAVSSIAKGGNARRGGVR